MSLQCCTSACVQFEQHAARATRRTTALARSITVVFEHATSTYRIRYVVYVYAEHFRLSYCAYVSIYAGSLAF
jgi:hypothetical protein